MFKKLKIYVKSSNYTGYKYFPKIKCLKSVEIKIVRSFKILKQLFQKGKEGIKEYFE